MINNRYFRYGDLKFDLKRKLTRQNKKNKK